MVHRFQLLKLSGLTGRPKGFTLIEMAIVLVISSVVLVAFYGFVAAHTMSSYEDCSEINVQSDIRKTIAGLVQELEGSHLVELDNYGSYVSYQVPKRGPSGALMLDANGNVQWGVWPPSATRTDPTQFVPASSGMCYFTLVFRDSTDASDKLVESALVTQGSPSGQNISGQYATGSLTNFTLPYDKCFIYGPLRRGVLDDCGRHADERSRRRDDRRTLFAPIRSDQAGDDSAQFAQGSDNLSNRRTDPQVWRRVFLSEKSGDQPSRLMPGGNERRRSVLCPERHRFGRGSGLRRVYEFNFVDEQRV